MSPRRKKKAGRPPKPKGEAKALVFCVRLSPDERALIDAAAERDGWPSSAWAREVLLAYARHVPQS